MKYYPKLNVYKISNLEFNPETETAYSYRWYEIFKVIKGTRCLNTFKYFNITIKHIYKMREFLKDQYVNIFEFEAPKGLQDLDAAIEYYKRKQQYLIDQTTKTSTQKRKNLERIEQAEHFQTIIEKIKLLMENH